MHQWRFCCRGRGSSGGCRPCSASPSSSRTLHCCTSRPCTQGSRRLWKRTLLYKQINIPAAKEYFKKKEHLFFWGGGAPCNINRINIPAAIACLALTPQPFFWVMNLSRPGAYSRRWIFWFPHRSPNWGKVKIKIIHYQRKKFLKLSIKSNRNCSSRWMRNPW